MHFLSVLTLASMPPLQTTSIMLLVVISLIGGIGITAIGPGGVLVTIALFTFTDLSPAEVAGTAIVTHIGTGIVGSLAYLRSGQLREAGTRRLATILSLAALVGTPVGAAINARLTSRWFGLLLAVFVALIGLWVVARELRDPKSAHRQRGGYLGTAGQAALGGAVALVSGIFGLGGPIISVPVMVIAGLPMLSALAAAQAQSVVVAGTGTMSYLAQGTVSWPLVLITGLPEMAGVWLGWRIAHIVPARPLKFLLAATLITLGPVLVLHG